MGFVEFLKQLFRRLVDFLRREYNYTRGNRLPVIRRHIGEAWVALPLWSKPSGENSKIRVVYITGMPRTGTSLAKNYLGDYPGLEALNFQRGGFLHAWRASKNTNNVIVDKATHYIRNLEKIHRAYGNQVAYCCLIRDPRDELLSLLETSRHREIKRDKRFWHQWARNYARYLRFAKKVGDDSRCYLIRYEDLVRWPVAVKGDFLTWLGLDASQEALTSTYRILNRDDIQDWKVEERRTITSKSVERWKMESDPERVDLFGTWQDIAEAEGLMKMMGYGRTDIEPFTLDSPGLRVFQK